MLAELDGENERQNRYEGVVMRGYNSKAQIMQQKYNMHAGYCKGMKREWELKATLNNAIDSQNKKEW